nr:Ig-like domain-containing protein [Chloroflexia bacterium]
MLANTSWQELTFEFTADPGTVLAVWDGIDANGLPHGREFAAAYAGVCVRLNSRATVQETKRFDNRDGTNSLLVMVGTFRDDDRNFEGAGGPVDLQIEVEASGGPPDTTPPTAPSLSFTSDSPTVAVRGGDVFVNANGAGSFTVRAETDDPESGIERVQFDVHGSDDEAPYTYTYEWGADGPSFPPAQVVRAFNGRGGAAGNSATSLTIREDAGEPFVQPGWQPRQVFVEGRRLIAEDADDGNESGVASVEYRWYQETGQTGAVDDAGFAAATSIGVSTNGPDFPLVWTDQPPDGRYTVVLRATDRVGNPQEIAPGRDVVVDNEPAVFELIVDPNDPDEMHVADTTLYYKPDPDRLFMSFSVEAATSEEDFDQVSGVSVVYPNVFGGDGSQGEELGLDSRWVYRGPATTTKSGTFTVVADNGAGLETERDFSIRPDGNRPSVAIDLPDPTIRPGETIAVDADDAGTGVDLVEVRSCPGTTCTWAQGDRVGRDDTAPYLIDWRTLPADGPYTLLARAVDYLGNAAVSDPVRVTVNTVPPDDTPPTAPELTLEESSGNQHIAGTTLYYRGSRGQRGTFTVRAATGDDESGIGKVAFPVVFGGDKAADKTSPYQKSYTWTGPIDAEGEKRVVATNRAGLTAAATFTVQPDAAKPRVDITSPGAAETVGPGVTIAVEAEDAVAGVAKVQVRSCRGQTCTWGTAKAVGNDTAAPYEVVWSTLPADGTYTLLAQAIDNVGNVATSAPV